MASVIAALFYHSCIMSAFGGKADMTVRGMSAFAVAIEGKADIRLCSAHVAF